jgi:DNA-binding HxlR family transcriptional regulator
MVVGTLANGPQRFNELKRRIGAAAHRMLTLTLGNMERDGLVTRTGFSTIPLRVDYEQTPLGHGLTTPPGERAAWAEAHPPAMENARRVHGARRASPAFAFEQTGTP